MGVLESEGPVQLAGLEGIAAVVVDDENVAQGTMDQIEPQIGTDLAQVTVVLDKGTEKHLGTEGIIDSKTQQSAGQVPFPEP